MNDTVVFEWSYTPDNYFEDEFETNLSLGNDQYKMVIKKGIIEVYINDICCTYPKGAGSSMESLWI